MLFATKIWMSLLLLEICLFFFDRWTRSVGYTASQSHFLGLAPKQRTCWRLSRFVGWLVACGTARWFCRHYWGYWQFDVLSQGTAALQSSWRYNRFYCFFCGWFDRMMWNTVIQCPFCCLVLSLCYVVPMTSAFSTVQQVFCAFIQFSPKCIWFSVINSKG